MSIFCTLSNRMCCRSAITGHVVAYETPRDDGKSDGDDDDGGVEAAAGGPCYCSVYSDGLCVVVAVVEVDVLGGANAVNGVGVVGSVAVVEWIGGPAILEIDLVFDGLP